MEPRPRLGELMSELELKHARDQWRIWSDKAQRQERTLRAMDLKLVGWQDALAEDLRRMIAEALEDE